MFLRCSRRVKDGKVHEYWNLVENRRLSDGRVAQRQVLYLGEINASQREAWRKTIEVQDQDTRRQVALFPAGAMPVDDVDAIGVRLSELSLRRPRQWGACWMALDLWQQLELDSFWRSRLRPSREGTPWLKVLKTLVAYRLIDPGSEWRLHREWFDASAMADLLDSDLALAQKNTLYRCLDLLVEHKDDLFKFLKRRWGELFGAKFDVLLYDLTSTYFETDVERGPDDLRQFGYSRDKRGDCRQVVIVVNVTVPTSSAKTASLEFGLDGTGCVRCAGVKAATCCARTSMRSSPSGCGRSTSSSPRSSWRSKSSSTIWRCVRSSTTTRSASRLTSSWPSSPTDCRSRSRPICVRWPAGSHRAR